MLKYALKRFVGAWPTLLIMIAIAFFMIRVAPGGPFDSERKLPPEIEARMLEAYHLDEPLYQQFGRYLAGLLKGDFGPSFQYKEYMVSELVMAGFVAALGLTVALFVAGAAFNDGILQGQAKMGALFSGLVGVAAIGLARTLKVGKRATASEA